MQLFLEHGADPTIVDENENLHFYVDRNAAIRELLDAASSKKKKRAESELCKPVSSLLEAHEELLQKRMELALAEQKFTNTLADMDLEAKTIAEEKKSIQSKAEVETRKLEAKCKCETEILIAKAEMLKAKAAMYKRDTINKIAELKTELVSLEKTWKRRLMMTVL